MEAADRPAEGGAEARGSVSYLTPALWTRLLEASAPGELAHAWLALQCGMIEHAVRGVVALAASSAQSLAPAAYWPEGRSGTPELAAAAEAAVEQAQGVIHAAPGPDVARVDAHVAFPILVDGRVQGVVAIALAGCPRDQLQGVVHRLQWGSGQLEAALRRIDARTSRAALDRIGAALDLVTAAVSLEHFEEAAITVATTLASRVGAVRVSLGVGDASGVEVVAISGRTDSNPRTQLVRRIAAAMQESLERGAPVELPAPEAAGPCRAHEELAQETRNPCLLTLPLGGAGSSRGALTLEGKQPFPPETVALCRTVAQVVGPLLEARRREDRSVVRHIADEVAQHVATVVGPERTAAKVAAGMLAVLLYFLAVARGDYRVDADTVLEASVQRVIAAPFDGYVAESARRAGDRVANGELLARLDDRELRLDRLRWERERARALKQMQQGRAAGDRVQTELSRAQVDQTEAQIALLNEHLGRAELRAPFAGLVLEGDLSQSLGAPVRRGETLFQIAPLDDYRVILQVDERDVADVAAAQRGALQLNSLPGERFEFEVVEVTPVASTVEGRNSFRVEGRLEKGSPRLRPGMEGIAKVVVDRRHLVWIWTHALFDWLRLELWKWLP